MIKYMLILMTMVLTGCGASSVYRVVSDIETTVECDRSPMYIHAEEDVEDVAAKLYVQNTKLTKCANSGYVTRKKIERYKEIK